MPPPTSSSSFFLGVTHRSGAILALFMGKQLRVGLSVFIFLLVHVSYHDPLFAQGQRAFLASPAEAQAYKGPCRAADLSQDWAWFTPGNTSSGGSSEGPPLKAFTGGASGKQASQTRCLSINHAPNSGPSANCELVLFLQSVHQEGRSLLWPVWQANRLLHREPGTSALAHSELGEYRSPLLSKETGSSVAGGPHRPELEPKARDVVNLAARRARARMAASCHSRVMSWSGLLCQLRPFLLPYPILLQRLSHWKQPILPYPPRNRDWRLC